jgi:orotate phosphoribosyltransferase-like protein
MNVEEVARVLFVSRTHVRVLVERGDLTGAVNDDGDFVVDDGSVERYRARLELARKAYFDSQDESNDPLGI